MFYQSKPRFIINTIQSKLEFYLFSTPEKNQQKLNTLWTEKAALEQDCPSKLAAVRAGMKRVLIMAVSGSAWMKVTKHNVNEEFRKCVGNLQCTVRFGHQRYKSRRVLLECNLKFCYCSNLRIVVRIYDL